MQIPPELLELSKNPFFATFLASIVPQQPVAPVELLPKLRSIDFLALVQWKSEIEHFILCQPQLQLPPLASLLSADLVTFLKVSTASTEFPKGREEFMALLDRAFRPSSASDRMALLNTVFLLSPTRLSTYRLDAAKYIDEFDRLYTALALPDVSYAACFRRGIRDPHLTRFLSDVVLCTPDTAKTKGGLAKALLDAAEQMDTLQREASRAAEVLVTTTDPNTNSTSVSVAPPAAPRNNSPPRISGASRDSTPRTTSPRRVPPLDLAERQRCVHDNLCFRCRMPNHRASDCPVFTTPATATSSAPAPRPSSSELPARRSTRESRPPERLGFEKHAAALIATGEGLTSPPQFSLQTPQGTRVACIVDTGANVSYAPLHYLQALNIKIEEVRGDPVITLADDSAVPIAGVAELDLVIADHPHPHCRVYALDAPDAPAQLSLGQPEIQDYLIDLRAPCPLLSRASFFG
ncbi:hypothetical protein PAPYR_12257 [Paratrimastix pyriformis]|uniref:CCHC-type domain-containing protein n=1 Tax=Paratrimastix pyriformis TaxID=342808 RepID=A0ABQ8U6S5_9EUKA|nr:hypothetical protein PAPYR_12257 [Paratrimastix pyriformis]